VEWGRGSSVYSDVELSYPDTKGADKFCVDGVCIYKYCDDDTTLLTIFVFNVQMKLP
jgi:hypothetical protein